MSDWPPRGIDWFYSDDSCAIACGDAARIIPTLPPVDLTVTSPPYDNLRAYNGYSFDFEAIAQGLWQVTKPGGVVVWVVGDATIDGSETGTSFRQALRFKEIGFNLHDTMIYEAAGTGAKGSNYAYWQAFEYMFVLSKGTPRAVNRIADIKNGDGGKLRGFRTKSAQLGSRVDRLNVVAPDYSVRPNVWRYAVGQNDPSPHPAPFPERMANDHIRSWSNPGDTILDPMCGSGTTLKMARKNGCKAIGIDISEEYCELSVSRLRQSILPFTELVSQ